MRAILEVLKRRRRSIALGMVVTVLPVVLITLLLPKTFVSTASFLIEPPLPRTDAVALDVLSRAGSAASVETEMELLRSRRVLEPVADSLDLHVTVRAEPRRRGEDRLGIHVWADSHTQPGSWSLEKSSAGWSVTRAKAGETHFESHPLLAEDGGPGVRLAFSGVVMTIPDSVASWVNRIDLSVRPFSETVARLREAVSVSAVSRQADVVVLTCPARTPRVAQEICRTIASQYLFLRTELQRDEATETAAFLREQVGIVGEKLEAAEDSVSQFRQRNRAVALETAATEGVRQVASLRAQRAQLEAERSALASLLDDIASGDASTRQFRDLASFPTFVRNQNQIVSRLVESLVELENERSKLSVTRSDASPDVVAIDERIAEIERQLQSTARRYERSLGAQVTSLDGALESESGQLSVIPRQAVEAARFERQVGLYEEIHAFLQMRLREAEVAQAVKLPSVRIVDAASLPFEPDFPRPMLNLVLAVAVGSALGLFLALYREQTDGSVREGQQLEASIGIPVLTMIPHVKRRRGAVGHLRPENGGSTPAVESIAIEAFRSLGVELQFAERFLSGGDYRTIAVTSPGRGEGKTFTSCNLALARSKQGLRTLLVDGDLRAAGVSRALRLARDKAGIRELVLGSATLDEVLHRLGEGASENLYVLPAGGAEMEEIPFLSGDRLLEILDQVTRMFDLVVVDTPPMEFLADAAGIASHVDAVILVVRMGVTDRGALERTLRRLERANANIAGMVLNDIDVSDSYRSYAYGYEKRD